MQLFNDWEKYKKILIDNQAKRYENEVENQKKIQELSGKFDLIQAAFDQLSEEQKEMLKNVPRTKEEWERFNEIGDDLEEKEEKLDEIWTEIDSVVDQLPFSSEELNEKFKELAMAIAKKHHLNN
ncbi:MAG: hypothetical protein ACYC3G_00350 [Minisyncoccota bacterium]